jgi:hypothetical protein
MSTLRFVAPSVASRGSAFRRFSRYAKQRPTSRIKVGSIVMLAAASQHGGRDGVGSSLSRAFSCAVSSIVGRAVGSGKATLVRTVPVFAGQDSSEAEKDWGAASPTTIPPMMELKIRGSAVIGSLLNDRRLRDGPLAHRDKRMRA